MEQLIKQFNLPNYIKGKSFAEASKLINNKFKDRKDSVSLKTKNELLQRLADAQEYTKMQEEIAKKATQSHQSIMPPMGSPIGNGMPGMEQGLQQPMMTGGYANKFRYGGYENELTYDRPLAKTASYLQSSGLDLSGMRGIQNENAKLDLPTDNNIGNASKGNNPNIAGYAGLATTGMDLYNTAKGDDGNTDTGSGVLGGAAKGAAAGAMFGPWGAAIGGVVGGVSGAFGASAAKRRLRTKQNNEALRDAREINNEYKKGGPIKSINTSELVRDIDNNYNKPFYHSLTPAGIYNPLIDNPYTKKANYVDASKIARPGIESSDSSKLRLKQSPFDATGIQQGFNTNIGKINNSSLNKLAATSSKNYENPSKLDMLFNDVKYGIKDGVKSSANWLGNNYESLLRSAPVVTNALQLMNMDKPAHETRQKLNQKYKPQHVDEMQLQNTIQNEYNNTSRALANASGGSTGSLRANLLGAQLNKTKSLSDAYMKADNINRAENEKGFRYGLETGKFNISQDNLEKDVNARNLGAYNTEKSKLISALGENIGAIGKEKVSSKRIAEMLGYTVDGKYIVDPKSGKKYTKEQIQKMVKDNMKTPKDKVPSTATNPFFNPYTMK